MIPLFSRYPRLASLLPYDSLGTLPTPVEPLSGLGKRYGNGALYVKRDDRSGALYGGNKVRKLEFLLADARKKGARRVITSGAAGSNHALATVLYARQCGFATTLMLFAQPPIPSIGDTLLAGLASGAELYHDETYPQHLLHQRAMIEYYRRCDGVEPYVIPAGGSSALGVVGFVNAAFELGEQILAKALPEPEAIFVAFGTMGTAAGLLLGLRALRLRSRLVAVRVVPDEVANRAKFEKLFDAANGMLVDADPAFPRCAVDDDAFSIEDDFFGDGYGIATSGARSAIDEFSLSEGIHLDPVYTGKTAAAFMAGLVEYAENGKPLLYWHTKNSTPLILPQGKDAFRRLPEAFHRYFTATETISAVW